jgi:hypothetical protein
MGTRAHDDTAMLWVLGDRIPSRVRRCGAGAATAACLGAAFMNRNFYVALGGTFPGLSAANATNERVSILWDHLGGYGRLT